MIPFEDAFAAMMQTAISLDTERVPLEDSVGRVLAENLCSDMDMPPFDKSAMDGYACRRIDLNQPLRQIGLIAAGTPLRQPIGPGECARIMTGAPLPEGADCVFILERSDIDPASGRVSFTGNNTSSNFCCAGEDLRRGEQILTKGTLLQPAHTAVMAAIGTITPLVSICPSVGVIATGNELTRPEQIPSGAKIRNSNSPQLCAQIRQTGAIARDYGIIPDSLDQTIACIQVATAENDLVILSGGASFGDFDYVPAAMKASGYALEFDSVAMKPGRPTLFGHQPGKWCFGLPGNPVSTFVVFERMVKPFLFKLMGHEWNPLTVTVKLGTTIKRKNSRRESALPVQFADTDTVNALEYHGSAHISAMTRADGIIILPVGCYGFEQGKKVRVRLL